MFLGVNMLELYVKICKETPEVREIHRDVIDTRFHLWINPECISLLIVFMCRGYFFKNTAQNL